MGLLAVLLIAFAGWLVWTGRLQRMTAKDGMAIGLAIVGVIMAAKGRPIAGAVPLAGAALYGMIRSGALRRGIGRTAKSGTRPPAPVADDAVAEASALLGLPRDADANAIRAAHRRLIASVHPDRGGTEALAAKINAARDTLLRQDEHIRGSRPV